MDVTEFVEGIKILPAIAERLDRVEAKLDRLLESTPTREYITVEGICTELDVSRDWLRSHPWVLPNFGVSDVPGRTKRWRLDTWREWSSDLNAREQAWRMMSAFERKRVLRVAV